MKHKAIKVGITSLVLALSFGGLLYTTLGEATEYYKHVDEVMTQPEEWYGKKLQLHGYVVQDSILQRKSTLDYKFKVHSNGQVVDATYTGVVPDTFKGDAEVVLKGVLTQNGFTVEPNGIMAKCPSKYEAKPTLPASSGGN